MKFVTGTGTDQRVSLTTGSTNAGRLVIAAHMPGGEFGSGLFQEKDGHRAVQDALDIRAGAHAVRRPERIRSPPHDATVPCFPVRRSRYDRIDMIGGTPERGATDNHVPAASREMRVSSSVAVLARRWYHERTQDVDMTSPADRDWRLVEWLRLREHSTSENAQPGMPAKILAFMVAPPGRPVVEGK
jgi:hypothetical protein